MSDKMSDATHEITQTLTETLTVTSSGGFAFPPFGSDLK